MESKRLLVGHFRGIAAATLIFAGIFCAANAQNFVFTSGIPKYDNPFANAKQNIADNTVLDGSTYVFWAGAFWAEVWERDGSYSIEMAAGHLDPATSKNTFQRNTATWNNLTVQRQDVCGHFGGWPNLTDGIVWATGAWAYYRQTGDQSFLTYAYPIVRNSLQMAETATSGWVVRDPADSLFRGCSSFMESNSGYPKDFANNQNYSDLTKNAVGNSKCGSTNMLYYHAYVIADSMAKLLGKPQATLDTLAQKALMLKTAINKQLWNSAKGYYYYIKYANGTKLDRNEGLADAFAILYDIADSTMKESILNNTVPSAWGYMCQYPQDPDWECYKTGCPTAQDADYYHTGMIWPFVQGYIAWASSKIKNMAAFTNNIDKCAQLWSHSSPGEFKEFYRPEQGTPDGGDRQLWSAAGYISMVFHGLFGMQFDVDGVRFDPMVPDTFKNAMTLNNFIYRKDTLNMTVSNPGKYLLTFKLDGVAQAPFIPGSLTGKHTVVMTMSATKVAVNQGIHSHALPEGASVQAAASAHGVTINFGTNRKASATLYALSGKALREFTASSGSIVVDNKNCKPGFYALRWRAGGAEGIEKVVVK
jgi:Amylo-alpha-1,6-glucosidase